MQLLLRVCSVDSVRTIKCSIQLTAVLPTLRFSREFELVILWSCVFLKTCGLLVSGLVLIEICLFWACFLQISVLRIAFFSNFMALLPFQFPAKGISSVFL